MFMSAPPIDETRMAGLRAIALHLRRAVIISGILDTAVLTAAIDGDSPA